MGRCLKITKNKVLTLHLKEEQLQSEPTTITCAENKLNGMVRGNHEI